jgi:hypothetical protein
MRGRVMNMSDKYVTKLYRAIMEPLTDLRIDLRRYGSPSSEQLDERLSSIENQIWVRVQKSINLNNYNQGVSDD